MKVLKNCIWVLAFISSGVFAQEDEEQTGIFSQSSEVLQSSEVFSQSSEVLQSSEVFRQSSEDLTKNEWNKILEDAKKIEENIKNKSYVGIGNPCKLNPLIPGCPSRNNYKKE